MALLVSACIVESVVVQSVHLSDVYTLDEQKQIADDYLPDINADNVLERMYAIDPSIASFKLDGRITFDRNKFEPISPNPGLGINERFVIQCVLHGNNHGKKLSEIRPVLSLCADVLASDLKQRGIRLHNGGRLDMTDDRDIARHQAKAAKTAGERLEREKLANAASKP